MSDLIACPACQRNNGIRRTTCIYCGAELPVTEATVDLQVPTFKPVEDWEHGYTVVAAPLGAAEPTPHQVARLSEIARIELEAAEGFFAARAALPVARLASRSEAELVARLLVAADIDVTIVDDAELSLEVPSRRVRQIRLGPDALDGLVLWADWDRVARDDVRVAVYGRVVSSRVELVEGAGRKRKSDAVDASHTFTESNIVDIYGPTLERSFRIKADSFDFSCLGARPALRLDDNVNVLNSLLCEYLGDSRFDGSFGRIVKLLEHAWPASASVRSYGLTSKGDFRKYTRSAVTTDVLAQFTRYSRLQYVLAGGSVASAADGPV